MSVFEAANALKYCEVEACKHDNKVYMHSFFLPPAIRPYYFTIHAFRQELFKIREMTEQSTLRTNRIGWWLENLNNIWDGRPAQEPISIALNEMRKYTSVRKSHFERMVQGRVIYIQLGDTEITNWESLDKFIDDNYTMPYYLLIELLQYYEEPEFRAATYVGRAYGIYQLLDYTSFYLKQGKCLFPETVLKKYNLPIGIYSEDVEQQSNVVPEQFYDAVLEVAAYGKNNISLAREMTGLPSYSFVPFLNLVRSKQVEAEQFYNRLENYNFNIFDPRSRKSPYFKLAWSMFRNFRLRKF